MNIEIGQTLVGYVSGIKPYGIFIKFGDIFGFCHISNCSHKFIKNLNDAFTIKQEITAKIIELDKNNNRINVSIKDCENNNTSHDFKNKKITENIKVIQYNKSKSSDESFEDMLKTYLKQSDERLESIGKRNQKYRKR